MVEIAVKETLLNSLYIATFIAVVFSALELYRLIFGLSYSRMENILRGTLAFALAVATSPLYSGESYGIAKDILFILVYSMFAFGLMVIGALVNDLVILNKVKNFKEIKRGNLAVTISESSNLLVGGLITRIVLDNYSSVKFVDTLFYLIGAYLFIQLGVVLTTYLYTLFFRLNGIRLKELIYRGNISAGINLSSAYIVTAFLMSYAFSEKELITSLLMSFLYFVLSVLLLIVVKILVDIVIVRETTIKEILEKDDYFRAFFIEMVMLSIVFVYKFLS
jgi:uncharacterized membrane protein YjfL (UPF0719 family)